MNTMSSQLRVSENANLCTVSLSLPFDVERLKREEKTRQVTLQTRSLLFEVGIASMWVNETERGRERVRGIPSRSV